MVHRLSLHKLSPQQWLNLLLAVQAILYVVYRGYSAYARGPINLGGDYLAFYAAAQVAHTRGYEQVYDLAALRGFQYPLYQAYATGPLPMTYATTPVPYLPVFILLLQPFQFLPFLASTMVWRAVNLVLLLLYLWRLRRTLGVGRQWGLLVVLLLSYASLLNFFYGQVNGWLLIFVGEFLLAIQKGKDWRAGLWLGGLLLKPQALLLFPLALLVGRRWKALAGTALSSAALLLASLLLAGPASLLAMARLITRYAGGVATNCPEIMMCWRGLGTNLATFLPAALAWALPIAGLVATAAAALSLWLRPAGNSALRWAAIVLGTGAAACALSWHSHTHMALLYAAPLLLVVVQGRLSRTAFKLWAALPGAVFLVLTPLLPDLAANLSGISMLGLNLYLLAWSVWAIWHPVRPGPGDSLGKGPAPVDEIQEVGTIAGDNAAYSKESR